MNVGKVELNAISAHIYEYDLESAKNIYIDYKKYEKAKNQTILKLHESLHAVF